MALPNIFTEEVSEKVIQRINNLSGSTSPKWGKMNAPQMLAHCNVTYELVYDDKHAKPGFFKKLMLKTFVKNVVTNEVPYQKSSRTGPQFLITSECDFDSEKKRLVDFIRKTKDLGEDSFHNKVSVSFGSMSKTEWSNMFYKHLDHHLSQFGV